MLSDERVVAYQAITMASPGNYIRVNAQMEVQDGMPSPPDDAMDDISESNIRKLKLMGDFWFERYGDAVVALLAGNYSGPSLDRIDSKTGQIHTAHTTLPVPLIMDCCNGDYQLEDSGKLADIAPTILDYLNISKPDDMTGNSLLIPCK